MTIDNRASSYLLGTALAVSLTACGGGDPPPFTGPTPAPRAAVTVTGDGPLVFHPSLDPTFALALDVPVHLQETAGGTADWNFARMSLLLNGAEVERAEIGSDVIRSLGYSRINPHASDSYVLTFRFNTDEVDDAHLILGFSDVNWGNQFTPAEPEFPGFILDPEPAFAPSGGAIRAQRR
jgi:hypothetical protein